MNRRASIDDLAAFACVARLRSFTRAAGELDTSMSNLSHTIKRLETRLDCRLLQRNSRSVSVTEAGEALLATLGPALDSIDGAIDNLEVARGSVGGTLRLTMTRAAYQLVVRPVLQAFAEAHPAATVEVVIDYGFRDIIADQFDAGIRAGEQLEQDMVALKIGPELCMAVVASPAYLARHGTPQLPEDLTRHRCINYRMMSAGTIYVWEFERDGKAFEVRVSGPLTFNEPDLMLDCTLQGLGVAYLLEHEVMPYILEGRLIRLLSGCTRPFPGFHLYYSSRRQMRPILAAFLHAVRRHPGR